MRPPTLTRTPWMLLTALGVTLLVGLASGLLAARFIWRTPSAASGSPTASASPAAPASASLAESAAPAAPAASAASAAPDLRRQQLIGVRTARVVEADVSPAIRTVGIVKPDERRQTEVTLKLDGWIRELFVDYTGAPVRKGQPLVSLYSPELLATQQEYLLARRGHARVTGEASPDAGRYAERLVEAARQRLALWEVPADQIQALDSGEPARDTAIFRSPVDGIVIDKPVTRGMRVSAGQRLYTIVDFSTIWIEADLREPDIGAVSRAMRATVTFDAFPDRPFSGPVTFVSPTMDAEARTVKARIELKNGQRLLKPGMFATVTLTPPARRALVVPADAVLDSGETQTVFVAQGDGKFEPRRIRIGRRMDDLIEVREGLRADEEVARSATFFLDADSQLRAALDAYAPDAAHQPASLATPAAPAAMPPAPAVTPPAAPRPAAPRPAAPRIVMTYQADPDPPAGGREHTFTVQLRDASGAPVTDAEVIVTFYMPPMPSMNMPAMRSETRLVHAAEGRYEGRGTVSMAGRWDVQVVATRNGQRIGVLRRTVVAQ